MLLRNAGPWLQRPVLWILLLATGSAAAQDLDAILQQADETFAEAKAGYEEARSNSSGPALNAASLKLEEARIRYLLLQEAGSPERQMLASERLRAVHQLLKLLKDGRVAMTVQPSPSAPQPVIPERQAIPEAKAIKDAENLVRELFKTEYARKAPAEQTALAKTLLQQAARTQNDPAGSWVLCRDAQEFAVQAGHVPTALAAVDVTARLFDIDAASLRMTTLAALGKTARHPQQFKLLTESQIGMIGDLLAADRYDAADKAAAQAQQFARRAGDATLALRSLSRSKEVSEARARILALGAVFAALAKTPDDPVANHEMGQVLCFVIGSWDLGLCFLAKGSDPVLKALAEKDLALPAENAGQIAMGDAWWDLAEEGKIPGRKDKLQERARVWYDAAYPLTTGMSRLKIEKRISERVLYDEPSPVGLVGRWRCHEGAGTQLLDSSGKNNHGKLQGPVGWVNGPGGTVPGFEGSSHASCGVEGMPAANAAQTLAWSHSVTATPSDTRVILALDDASAGFSLSPGFSRGRLGVWKWGEAMLVSVTPPPPGEWHAFAYTYDCTTHRFYVDGVLKDSASVPVPSASPKRLEFARWGGGPNMGPGLYFTGRLSEVRIYTRVLGEAEIQLLSRLTK